MLNAKRVVAAALLTSAGIAMMAGPASAMPMALGLQKAAPSQIETVRWGRCWGCGVGAGFVAGAIIGGAITAPYYYGPGYYGGPYYYGAGPYYPAGPAYYGGPAYGGPAYGGPAPAAAPGDAVAYCAHRFRSYDPRTGTYLGNDGARHPCP